MSTLVDTAPASPAVELPSTAPFAPQPVNAPTPSSASAKPASKLAKPESLLLSLVTTSACLHLLIIGLTGYGGPKATARHIVHHDAPPPPVIENVHIEDAPPPPPTTQPKQLLDTPPPSDSLSAPAPAASVAAVAANVAVNFAIKVAGPVHIVKSTDEASGALAAPIVVPHEVAGHDLLTPELVYPRFARAKHWTGQVVVEFRTTATGDIIDVKVRESSGHAELDEAAINNLRLGRWVGEAGYFTKTYEFVLH